MIDKPEHLNRRTVCDFYEYCVIFCENKEIRFTVRYGFDEQTGISVARLRSASKIRSDLIRRSQSDERSLVWRIQQKDSRKDYGE